MVQYEKPPIVKELLFKKILWVVPFVIVGLLLMCYSASELVRYCSIEDKAVTLPATVCRVEEGYGDSGTEYDVFVEYSYGGKQYEIRYIVSVSDMWLDRIGQTVDITINPYDTTEQLEDMKDPIFFRCFSACRFLPLASHSRFACGTALGGSRCMDPAKQPCAMICVMQRETVSAILG